MSATKAPTNVRLYGTIQSERLRTSARQPERDPDTRFPSSLYGTSGGFLPHSYSAFFAREADM